VKRRKYRCFSEDYKQLILLGTCGLIECGLIDKWAGFSAGSVEVFLLRIRAKNRKSRAKTNIPAKASKYKNQKEKGKW